jgi:hypothetical protein
MDFFGVLGNLPASIWVVLGLLVLVMALSPWLESRSTRRKERPRSYPYEAREALFTPTELAFLHALKAAAPDCDIHGKVRLEDVIAARRGLPKADLERARGYIKSRHLDFVLCCPETGRVRCAVELDDASHRRPDRQRADDIKTRAMQAAGVPLVRVRPARTYDAASLREALALERPLAP